MPSAIWQVVLHDECHKAGRWHAIHQLNQYPAGLTLLLQSHKKKLSLTSVSASEVVIGDVADKFKLPCQRVHAVTVTVCRRPNSNRRWLTPALKAADLDHSATTLRQQKKRPLKMSTFQKDTRSLLFSVNYMRTG